MPPRSEPESQGGAIGERRHLTVLFCDLVGSTAIAAQLDPEEWRDMVAAYHRAAAAAITRFGGHVAKYLGDGVMAFFGYPQAHDNDGERAARAGLAILGAVAKLNEQTVGPKLAARVGIHSGAVVVGTGAGEKADVFGDTPNVAARVQEVAEPATVVVSDDTHRLISGLFVVEDRGAPALKGVARSIHLYRVVRPSGVRGRLEAAAATRGLTPFIGRDEEIRVLLDRWRLVNDGAGQMVLITGEAGIGKSRLVQHFHQLIAGVPHTSLEAAAAAFFQNTPFYPVTEMLKQAAGWHDGGPGEEQTRLVAALEQAGIDPGEAVPLLAPLFNLAQSANYPVSALSAEQQRRRLFAMLVKWTLALARAQPAVITIEDLHWADPSSLELIELLVEQGASSRLLFLFTARPEFRAQWPMRAHHTQITLNRLSATNVRAMVREVAARHGLSEETIAAMVERTGGVPLFVEELTRAVLESGDAKLTGREIPATLHDSLMARLDRLGPAKEVIQVGAVIGSEFSYDLLHALHPATDADLDRSLRALAQAELLYVRGTAPEATYQFKHALIRDAAYEALLKSRRREMHRQVAHAIEQQFGALGQAHPEVLARHWTEAGETEPAIGAWTKAGEAARARNASHEAQRSYEQALMLLRTLPESPERDLRELDLSQSRFYMLTVTQGHAAPKAIEMIERVAALAEKSSRLQELVNVMNFRCNSAIQAGDFRAAGIFADRTLELALREGSPTSLASAHGPLVVVRQALGDLQGVEHHFSQWLKYCEDPDYKQARIPGSIVVPFGFASFNAWFLGRANAALQRDGWMMEAARRNGNKPGDLAWAGYTSASLRTFMGEWQQAEAIAARAVEICEEYNFPNIAAFCRCTLGLARAALGRASEGIELIRAGLTGFVEVGTRMPGYVATLGWAQLIAGDIDDALASVEQALHAFSEEATTQPLNRPSALTLRGAARLIRGDTELAEADLREAIEIYRAFGAKMPQLGSTTRLAQLLANQGRREEARTMLAEIYGTFTEGFETANLKEARALLDSLEAES